MKPTITVVDYGMGNLFSVARAFDCVGASVVFADTPAQIRAAKRLVLPGVGAFADGMAGLKSRGLIAPLQEYAAGGHPFLGICLGMQMMLDVSEEFGEHAGLGLVPGRVIAIPRLRTDGQLHKIPHIGWNVLQHTPECNGWDGTLLQGSEPGASVYFVHSFTAVPAKLQSRLADCDYGGHLISAAIQSGAMYGCQFHPEKSGKIGLRMLRNFLALH